MRASDIIKKVVGSVWVLEDEDAALINSDRVNELTRQLLSRIAQAPDSPKLSALAPASDLPLILASNKTLLEQCDSNLFLGIVREIKKYSVIKFFRPNEEEMLEYFAAVIDILTRPLYVEHLRAQLENPRHLHGLARSVVKHLWSVSLFAFLWTKKKNLAHDLARAGLYHDITLTGTGSYIADFQHPLSGAEIARRSNESASITAAVEQHLFADILRLRRFPSSRIARLLLIADVVVSTTERFISIGLTLRRRLGR